MKYDMTKPCDQCPFLAKFKRGYTMKQLEGFSSGQFPCHKTAELRPGDDGYEVFKPTKDSQHCAGALIFLEKRDAPNQMMRICERIGMYDRTKLDMTAKVR